MKITYPEVGTPEYIINEKLSYEDARIISNHIAAITAERDALKAAIVAAVSKPHPTWCKARQGQECTCYQKELRAKLETK